MNKRINYLFLMLFLLLIPVVGHAESKYSCSRVVNEHENYLQYKDEFDSINCDTVSSESDAAKCNELTTKMNSSLQYLYNTVDSHPECINDDIQNTLDDNDTKCKSVYQTDLKDTTSRIMTIFYIIAPFLLILFGSIDLTKIVAANDPEGMKKARSNLTKRTIAFLLIFIVPFFVNLVLSFISNEYKLDGNFYSCETNYYFYQKKYVATYTKSKRSMVTTSADWHIDWFQGDDRWASHAWYGDSGSVGAAGCGSLATSIVCAHYLGDDSEKSPCYPLNTADEYYRHALQPNLSGYAITTFFNEWHPEVGVTATIRYGSIDLNELDEVLAKGGSMIVCYGNDILYNGRYVWTSGGHYVTVFGGNQVDGYRVADSNGGHSNGWSGIAEWAPYGEHVFEKEYIIPAAYYYFIEKK